jgi:DNA polymerase-3 subunit epsilon
MTAIVLDTETTGLSRDTDRVIEVAIVPWEDGGSQFHARYNPGMPIPAEATRVHGISDDDVKNCHPFSKDAEILADIISTAEAVIGYNPFYDQGMLDAEFARCGVTVKWPTIVCAKRVWDCYEPKERNLMCAYRRFVNREGFNAAHSAMADTQACREVLRHQINYFGLHGVSWEDFDPERKLWWMDSHHVLIVDQTLMMNFGKWTGKPVRDVDHGFWRWLLDRDFPKHLLLLAMEATKLIEKGLSKDVIDIQLYTWARSHQKGVAP